jgi:hypothetical protein
MNIQASWELEVAEDELGETVERDVLPRTAARSAWTKEPGSRNYGVPLQAMRDAATHDHRPTGL